MDFIPFWRWNEEVVEKLPGVIGLAGINVLVTVTPQGRLVSVTGNGLWQHPWFTFPAWSDARRSWAATVRPGFENGWDPLVPGAGLEGEDVDLLSGPTIPLRGYRRGIDAESEPVKVFFKALGVRETETDQFDLSGSGVSIDTTPREESKIPPRSLVAVDFYLAKARASYSGQASIVDASGGSGQVVDYSVSFDTSRLDRVGNRARLMQAPLFEPVRAPTLIDRLLGSYVDPGEDRVLISTVYLLSPPNVEGEPDRRWQPYVKHNAFWNMCHAARNLPPPKPYQPIRLYTGLLGGLADVIFNQLLTSVNEFGDKVNGAVNTTTNEGRFWSV